MDSRKVSRVAVLRAGSQPLRHRGQALPLGLALIMAGALGALVLFNSGQMASEKTRVANTADAAVYSGLIWQARTLNFQAYTNRAMVANQVAIAQMVSLGSWTNYGRISARNLDYAIGWIPIVKPFTAALLQAMTSIEEVVHRAASTALPIIDGVNQILSVAQENMFTAAFAATPEVIASVVSANDPRYKASSEYSLVSQAQHLSDFSQLTTRYNDEGGLARKATVIMDSRDEFSADRGWDRLAGFLPKKVWVTPIDRFQIIKEGTTELVQNGTEFEWRGKDGLSLHWEHYRVFRGWKNKELPMGWGSNYAEGDGACNGNECRRWLGRNKKAEKLADSEAEDLGRGYSGVFAYRSLTNLSSDNKDPRLNLIVEVQVATGQVKTAEKVENLGSASKANGELTHGIEQGMFYTEDQNAASNIAAMSAGEVFFERPVINDSDELKVSGVAMTEYANLFNPYWDVRLTDVPVSERAKAWALRAPELFGNGGQLPGSRNRASQSLQTYARIGNQGANALLSGVGSAIVARGIDQLSDFGQQSLQNYIEPKLGNNLSTDWENFTGVLGPGSVLEGANSYLAQNGLENTGLNQALDLNGPGGLLHGADNIAANLVAGSAIENAITEIYSGIDVAGITGTDIAVDLGQEFTEAVELQAQLVDLQSTIDSAEQGFTSALESYTGSIQRQLNDTVADRISSLEQDLGQSLESLGVNRQQLEQQLRDSTVAEVADTFQQGRQQLSDGFTELSNNFAQTLNDRFGDAKITPEAVDAGVFDQTRAFIAEQSKSFSAAAQANVDGILQGAEGIGRDTQAETLQAAEEYLDSQLNDLTTQLQNQLQQQKEAELEQWRREQQGVRQ